MRTVVAAIALVFAIGAALPTEVDARAPRELEKWGCTFTSQGLRTQKSWTPLEWYGVVLTTCPRRQHRFVLTLSIFEDLPGRPIRFHSGRQFEGQYGGPSAPALITTVQGGLCTRDGPPPANPYFLRVKVQRVDEPGAAWVASHGFLNPCPAGLFPHPYPEHWPLGDSRVPPRWSAPGGGWSSDTGRPVVPDATVA